MCERAIDGCAADAVVEGFQVVDELLGVEQALLAEHGVEHHGALGGELELLAMEIAAEDGADGLIGGGLLRRGVGAGEGWEDVGGTAHYNDVTRLGRAGQGYSDFCILLFSSVQ